MYVITGATGNTGSVIAETLSAAGKKVRVVGRDAKRLERFRQKGADAFVANAEDNGALTEAFTGQQAAYVMIPPNMTAPDYRAEQERTSDAMAAAIERSRIPYVVMLSSFGASKTEGTGPVVGLHNFEQKLGAIAGLTALYLRCGYFMENLLPQVDVIRAFGIMAGPVRADLKLPMIATQDIGQAAAKALLDLSFTGKSSHELLGAGDITYAEMAAVVGGAIGKSGLSYQQMPNSQLKPALTAMGMTPNMADLILEMAGAINSGHMAALEPRTAANATPTTIEAFAANQFAAAYNGKAARA